MYGVYRLEFRRACIDPLVGGAKARLEALDAHGVFVGAEQRTELTITNPGTLEGPQHVV